MISMVRLGIVTVMAGALAIGPVTGVIDSPATAPPQVRLVAHTTGLGDDVADAGKCAYKVAGAGVAKKVGKSVWNKVKKRKLPGLSDAKDAAAVAAREQLAMNPYLAGAMIIGCTLWTADPAG